MAEAHNRSWICEDARRQGPTEEPLDDGVSTHRWACAREGACGGTVVLLSSVALRCGEIERARE
jgi:hypothetical protein